MKPCLKRCCHFHIWNVIPVFIETTEPDILGKQRRKRVSWCEKKPDFTKLRLVYKVQNAWELSQISVEKDIFFSLYLSHRTSAFGNPLVKIQEYSFSDGRTSGSFLPWIGSRELLIKNWFMLWVSISSYGIISNSNWTKWNVIISKSDERELRRRFEITSIGKDNDAFVEKAFPCFLVSFLPMKISRKSLSACLNSLT